MFRIGVILVLAVSICVSAGRPRTEQAGLISGLPIAASPDSGCDHDNLVEQLWTACGLDLLQITGDKKIISAILSEEVAPNCAGMNLKAIFLMKPTIQKFTHLLPYPTRQTVLDCLSKKRFQTPVSGVDNISRNWFIQYLESLFSWSPIFRRSLVDQSYSKRLAASVAAPASAPAPAVDTLTGSPSPSPDSLSSRSSNGSPPGRTPSPFFPSVPHDSSLQPSTGSDIRPDVTPALPSKHSRSSKREVLVAVLTTAAGTFLLVAILFWLYRKCCSNSNLGDGQGPRDDRPLLTLSMSDFSLGSSPKPFGFVNSMNNEKLEPLSSFKTNQSQHGQFSSLETNHMTMQPGIVKSPVYKETLSVETASGRDRSLVEPFAALSGTHAALPLPPGRMFPIRSGPSPPRPSSTPPPPARMASQIKPSPTRPPVSPHPPPPPGGGKPNQNTPPPPPPPNAIKPGQKPSPPPPPKSAFPCPPPSLASSRTGPSLGPNHPGTSGHKGDTTNEVEAPKAKLKPFFWDKVLANPDHSMVWHQIHLGSFQFNEEMIESLFGYNSTSKSKVDTKKESASSDSPNQYVQILDPKKAHNLSILLRALNVTIEEVRDGLLEGNELPIEHLQTLLKMAPTTEEEKKLRLYNGEPSQLGPAERFLKAVVDIPFTFKRIDALLFMGSLKEEMSIIKDSLAVIEVACKELRSSRLFLKLLEAVLKTGNRMNDGTFRGGALAFKLDTLLKLADVKGTDGKTTLLHFVVQEIIRSEGIRAARAAAVSEGFPNKSDNLLASNPPHNMDDHYCNLGLQVVAGLAGELENVRKAAILDIDALSGAVAKLGDGLVKMKEFLNSDMSNVDPENGFYQTLRSFVWNADTDITWLFGEEKRIRSLVKNTTDYFHGNSAKDEGLRLFGIVRDFLGMLDKACKEVTVASGKASMSPRNMEAPIVPHMSDPRQLLFPTIKDRRVDSFSSDDER